MTTSEFYQNLYRYIQHHRQTINENVEMLDEVFVQTFNLKTVLYQKTSVLDTDYDWKYLSELGLTGSVEGWIFAEVSDIPSEFEGWKVKAVFVENLPNPDDCNWTEKSVYITKTAMIMTDVDRMFAIYDRETNNGSGLMKYIDYLKWFNFHLVELEKLH